jgi:outer membrane lipoprotein-sorting protein
MRWEYARPERKFFIYDGGTLWIYEPDVPQVFKGAADAERLAKALAFLTGEGRILDEYRAKTLNNKKYNFPNGFVIGLWPKQTNSPFKRVEIYIEPQTYRVVRSVVVDQEDNRNRLDFAAPSINKNLSDAVFSFTPPPDVPVLQAP